MSNKKITGLDNLKAMEYSLQHYLVCDKIINHVRQEIITKSDKLLLAKTASETYRSAVGFCLKSSKICSLDKVSYYKQLAFYFSEKDKTQILLDDLAKKQTEKKIAVKNSALIKQKEALREKIVLTKIKLAKKPLINIKHQNLTDTLFKARRDYEAVIDIITKKYPNYKYNTEIAKIPEIQLHLNNSTAIRSYTLGDSLIYIFTITKNKFSIDTVSKPKDFNLQISDFKHYQINTFDISFKNKFIKVAEKLYQQLFPKFASINDSIKKLIIIPNDSLSLIPFEALLTEQYKGIIGEFSEYPFLLKKYIVQYSPSVNIFYQLRTKRKTKAKNEIAIFAPVFNDDEELYLPYTVKEANSIYELFDNKKSKKLMYTKASEQYVKSDSLKNYRIIHFATHAYANTRDPLLSRIVLTQKNKTKEDGFLHANEIYGLNWNADLVNLSACETAVGKVQNGEGVMDLSRVFFYAGASNVSATLWKVDDENTTNLMILFYKYYKTKKLDFATALHKAKLEILKSKRVSTNGEKQCHTAFWSAFILIGK